MRRHAHEREPGLLRERRRPREGAVSADHDQGFGTGLRQLPVGLLAAPGGPESFGSRAAEAGATAVEPRRKQMEEVEVEGAEVLFKEMEQTLLIDRNQKWAPIIAGLVPGKTVVLAVGAAHLSGETGMLRSLEKMGYELSPL